MLFRLLDTIRTKPKAQRQQYAFFGAAIITAIIFGIWSFSVPGRIASVTAQFSTSTPTSQVATAPFAGLWQQLRTLRSGSGDIRIQAEDAVAEANLESIIADFTTPVSPPEDVSVESDMVTLPSGSRIKFNDDDDAEGHAVQISTTSRN